MATFTVFLGRKHIGEYFFDSGPLVVGRHPDCDIYINQEVVSRHHAVIKREGSTWSVEIAEGKNGLFVNGEFTSSHVLKTGDRIEIGRAVIQFTETLQERRTPPKPKPKPVPRVRMTPELAAMLEGVPCSVGPETSDPWATVDPHSLLRAPPPQKNQPAQGAHEEVGTMMLSMNQLEEMKGRTEKEMSTHLTWFDKDNNQQTLVLDQRETVLGKGSSADIQIHGGLGIGNRFAVITMEPGGVVYLSRCSFLTTVKVNGTPVKDQARLMDGDKITIHSTTLVFRHAVL